MLMRPTSEKGTTSMLQRMLIDKIENRILVGVVMFVGIMVLVGWVAINEEARMQSFQRQFEARSIERGAELFAANCSTCHGADGRGLLGRAPALNSPHFFGHDFTANLKIRVLLLNQELSNLENERLTLAAELGSATSARREEINARLAEIQASVGADGLPAEIAAVEAEITNIQNQLLPATLKGYPNAQQLAERPEWVTRLGQAQWVGTLESFVITTLTHGRAQNRYLWGENAMVAWGQEGGGPLRRDQLGDLASYILNWDKGSEWTVEDALLVNQYAIVPLPGGGGGGEMADAAGDDVQAILASWEENGIVGDPERGKAIYENTPSERGELLGCSACHAGGVAGPATDLTWDTVVNERLTLAQFAGYTPEQYLVESIVNPNAYVVPSFQSGVMPQNFANRVTEQDLADIVAYLKTYSAGQ